MMRWLDGRPGMWFGWTDMGPIQIPPFPPYQLFTDRVTGLVYWLTMDPTNTFVAITLTSPPKGQPFQLYAAFDEPYISGNPGLAQLIVSNGVLAVGPVIPLPPSTTEIEMAPVYARKATAGSFNTTLFKIILASVAPGGIGTYGFIPYTYVQTPNPPPGS